MVHSGHKIRFRPPKIRFQYTLRPRAGPIVVQNVQAAQGPKIWGAPKFSVLYTIYIYRNENKVAEIGLTS
jgi:hypothetical protein